MELSDSCDSFDDLLKKALAKNSENKDPLGEHRSTSLISSSSDDELLPAIAEKSKSNSGGRGFSPRKSDYSSSSGPHTDRVIKEDHANSLKRLTRLSLGDITKETNNTATPAHYDGNSTDSEDDERFENFVRQMRNNGNRISSDVEDENGGMTVERHSHLEDDDESDTSSLDGFIVADDASLSYYDDDDESNSLLDSDEGTSFTAADSERKDDDEAFYLKTTNLLNARESIESSPSDFQSDKKFDCVDSPQLDGSYGKKFSCDSPVKMADILSDSDEDSFDDLVKGFEKSLQLCTPAKDRSREINLDRSAFAQTNSSSGSILCGTSLQNLISSSEDDGNDDDVVFVSESVQTPLPVRNKTPFKFPNKIPKSISVGTPQVRSKVLDRLHHNLAKTEPKIRKQPSTKTEASFLNSLSTNFNENKIRHPDADRYVRNFKKYRDELIEKLKGLYNETVFDSKLCDVPVTINKRLLKTAGLCKYMHTKNTRTKHAEVEISDKVCDTAERVRDTLIHEMCHAAVWVINEQRDGHGKYWQYWARRSELTLRDLPPIRRCHSYDISTKYVYKCRKCGQQVGRHSRSLDVNKKLCGICGDRFELLVSGSKGLTPSRPPNKFALFVKENFAEVKRTKGLTTHKDVMKELSRAFSNVNV